MKLQLSKLENGVTVIDNTYPLFEGTELAEDIFSIEVKRLSRADTIDISQKAFDEDGNISNGEYSKALFIASLGDATGFYDEDGVELESGDQLKEVIWEIAPNKLVEAIKNEISNFQAGEVEKKSETETSMTAMPDGMLDTQTSAEYVQ